MNQKLLIIGCGSSGQATAAYFALGDIAVTLCPAPGQETGLESLRNGILLRGAAGRVGLGKPKLVDSIAEALSDASNIIVSVPAQLHAPLAASCAPHLRAGHTILVSPGNLGSMLFRKAGMPHGVAVAELSDNLWACRSTGRAEVMVALPLRCKRVAAYPATDTAKVIEAFAGILELTGGRNIIETTLNSPNVVTHVAGSILNAVQIEKQGADFAFFQHGLSPSVISCMAAVEQERNQVLDAIGLAVYGQVATLPEKLLYTPELDGMELFRQLDGPSSLTHRYIEEDALCGMALLVSIAQEYGLQVPVSAAVMAIASCFNGYGYIAKGRTLHNMGLSGKTHQLLLAEL